MMTAIGRHNIAKMYSSTTGTGTLTLTTAVALCNTFANAGAVNGEALTFVIHDPSAGREVSRGIYTSSGLTLTRDTVLSSTNGGSKINCSGRQTVAITYAAEDITPFASYYGSGTAVSSATNGVTLTLDTEWDDQMDIASVASNAVTVAKKGWYWIACNVFYSSASAFNGYVNVDFEGYVKKEGYTTAMNILSDQIYIGPFLYNVTSDATVLGPVTFDNQAGSSITATINDLTILKVGIDL